MGLMESTDDPLIILVTVQFTVGWKDIFIQSSENLEGLNSTQKKENQGFSYSNYGQNQE